MKIFWAIITILTMFWGLDFSGKALHVEKIWARAAPAGAAQATVFLTIRNKSGEGDQLLGASSPVAEDAHIQSLTVTNGLSQEAELKNLPIANDETKELRPQGVYIKLTGLKKALNVGESFPITFRFTKAGVIDEKVHVEQPNATVYDNF